jgi:CheY-like chemotaxis protein
MVVEDEALVATMVADMLEELGGLVVGPAVTLAEGLALAETAEIDVAVLDVNLRGQRVDPVAEMLQKRGIPFVFATGYGGGPGGRWADAPTIDKPYAIDGLARILGELADPPAC